MKRFVLWAGSLMLLMALSAATALPAPSPLEALSAAELLDITAGAGGTCDGGDPLPPSWYPTVDYVDWEVISVKESKPVTQNVRRYDYVPNDSPATMNVSVVWNNNCRRVLVSGGANIGASIGFHATTVIHCAEIVTRTVAVPPFTTVEIYLADLVTYTTYTSREVLVYTDGYREYTGRTESARVEDRITYMGTR